MWTLPAEADTIHSGVEVVSYCPWRLVKMVRFVALLAVLAILLSGCIVINA